MTTSAARPLLPDLEPPDAPRSPEERERWRITGTRSAEWVLRKLAKARTALDALAEDRDEYLAQIAAWWADARRPLEADVAWAESVLRAWALEQREEDPEARTFRLPSGTVSTRRSSPTIVVADASRVASSLARARVEAYEALYRSETVVDVRALRQAARVGRRLVVDFACGCIGEGVEAVDGGLVGAVKVEHACDVDDAGRSTVEEVHVVSGLAAFVVDGDGYPGEVDGVEVEEERTTVSFSTGGGRARSSGRIG